MLVHNGKLTALSQVRPPTIPFNTIVNVCGVVIDYQPPILSRGGDYTVSLIICDESNPSGVRVRIFREDEMTLPRVSSNGDIVIFAGMRVTNYQNQTILLATNTDRYQYIMSRLPSIPTWAATTVGYPSDIHASPADLAYVGKLRSWWSKTGGNGLSQVTYSQPSDPNTVTVAAKQSSPYVGFSLINKMELRKFYDCVCQVVKVFPQESYLSVYITDYTTNKLLHAYDWTQMKLVEDEHANAAPKWNGPWGFFTMQVTLWDANAEGGRQWLREGQYVLFKKLNTKENRDGKMEGALHGDRKYPNKVNFFVIQNPDKNRHIRAIRMRARQYERIWEENHKERYETFMRERAAEVARHREGDRASEEAVGNPKIAIQKCLHPITSIRDILKPPHSGERYENRKYRILCKVIDYRPHNLVDFAQPEKLSDNSDESTTPSPSGKKWVWRFALLVQGEDDEALRVIVAGKGAEYLLDMPATDLRTDNNALAELRHKLTTLWGNLQEIKEKELEAAFRREGQTIGPPAEPQNRAAKKRNSKWKSKGGKKQKVGPSESELIVGGNHDDEPEELATKLFQACISEYGVDSERYWQMHSTMIKV